MIKLIASDLDGTLLKNGAQQINDDTMKVLQKALDAGILFAPASGRMHHSLMKLFAPIQDRIIYIADNGAFVKYQGETIVKRTLNRATAFELMEDIYQVPNCEFVASGEDCAYMKPKSEAFRHRMTKIVNYDMVEIEDFEEIPEDIIKVSVCDMSGIVHSQEHFLEGWKNRTCVAVSGELFMDMTAAGVNKGFALQKICAYFGWSAQECAAFGDNFNDVEMLDFAGYSYAMERAVPEVKQHAKFVTDSVEKEVLKWL